MKRANELGITSLSQTDHGSMSGHREFYHAAREAGIKPILGVEAYISSTDRFDRRANAKRQDGTSAYNHVTLLAQDQTGLINLYKMSEIAWTEGFYGKPRCLLPGQEVVTRGGMKLIEDINVGDEVLDHNGTFSPVTKTMKNRYSGAIYGINLSNRYGRTTWMTGDHPVLVRDRSKTLSWVPAKEIVGGRPNGKENVNNWNSWVCFPILKEGINQSVDVISTSGWEYIGADTWKKHAERKKDSGTYHYATLPSQINVDADFARFIGLFIAEGWTTKRGEIGFAFHRKEVEYADFVCDYLEMLTGKRPRQRVYEDKLSRDIILGHKVLSENLERWCGKYARNKKIPDFIMDSTGDVLLSVWTSILDGDGCWQKKSPHASLTQTSEMLAWQMKTLGASVNGDFCSVRAYNNKSGFPNGRQGYSLNFSYNVKHRHNLRDDNYVYRPVKSVDTKLYDGYVYNIEVSESHSYTTDFVTHNCDTDLLEEHSSGLIVLTGCLNGIIAKRLELGDDDGALQYALRLKNIFGENVFMEVQSHNPPEINHKLLALADSIGMEPAMASDCHYANQEDLWIEEAMLIMATKPKLAKGATVTDKMDILEKYNYLYPERKMSFQELELYLRSYETERDMFARQGIDRTDIFENTNLIADRVSDYEMPTGLDLLPKPKYDPNNRLKSLVTAGLKGRGLFGKPEYMKRAEMELGTIQRMNQAPYFLVVADMTNYCKSHDIRIGPGRGSAAGSLVLYALGVTNVDPIKYKLLFARFLNEERNDLGDIDQDIADDRRAEVKEYLARKFKNVAGISTFTYQGEVQVIKDAASVLNVPFSDVNKITTKISTFDEFETSSQYADFRAKYPDVLKLAKALRGRLKSVGMHASGLVISNDPLWNYASIETRAVPGSKTNERLSVVGNDMDTVAEIGLVKFDLLGLKTLSIIDDTIKDIKARHGIDIILEDIDLDDAKVAKDLSLGYTMGVFQAEQPAFTRLLKEMHVDKFDHIVAANALVRPGAMNTIGPDYIARKQGRMSIPNIHPIYDEATEDTYGSVLYQEQVMLLCNRLAGMSWSDSDRIRKIIGKKKDVHEFDAYREAFITGASEHVTPAFAEKLWHDFEAHAGYSFNKCASGKTLIRRASSGRYCSDPDISLEDLYTSWYSKTSVGKKYRHRGVKVMAMGSDGKIRPQRVKGVYQNGVKETFRVTLSDGKFIDATANHKHLTSDGYVRVDKLNIGDTLYTTNFVYEKTDTRGGLGHGWAKGAGRAVASDGRNRPSLGGYSAEYKRNVTLLTEDCANCGSSSGRLEVAHLNSNNKDNRLENLARLCNSCHKKLDYQFGSRKKRHSKGYSLKEVTVVSIESNGYEMTYDLEMDTSEHNWVGNGVVTHNSHSVAYSMLTMWTAWLKHYYPLEYMKNLLRRASKEQKTSYLLEVKRLGIKLFLPHINKSKANFEIEGGGIRYGFSNIKYLSEDIGNLLIALGPFESAAAVWALVDEKNNGINSRAIGSLDKVGALAFPDNPRTGKESEYFWEYLGLPSINSDSLPDFSFDEVKDVDETGTFVVLALVQEIKRGTGWSRVRLVDETGSVGVFHSEASQVEPGAMYAFLIASNRIMRYINVNELDDVDDAFVKWLHVDKLNIKEHEKVVLAFSTRRTKAGKNMATVVFTDKDKTLDSALVFATMYPRGLGLLKPGRIVKVRCGTLDDGTRFVKEINESR